MATVSTSTALAVQRNLIPMTNPDPPKTPSGCVVSGEQNCVRSVAGKGRRLVRGRGGISFLLGGRKTRTVTALNVPLIKPQSPQPSRIDKPKPPVPNPSLLLAVFGVNGRATVKSPYLFI